MEEIKGDCPGNCGSKLENWPDDKVWFCEGCDKYFCDNCHQGCGSYEHDEDYSSEDSEGDIWFCKECSSVIVS